MSWQLSVIVHSQFNDMQAVWLPDGNYVGMAGVASSGYGVVCVDTTGQETLAPELPWPPPPLHRDQTPAMSS